MTDGNDDWLENQATPPRAVGDPAYQPAKVVNLRDQLANAPDAPESGPDPRAQGDGPHDRGSTPEEPAPAPPKKREGRPIGEIWPDCPVKPLGVNDDKYFYLDVHGQMRDIKKHERMVIMQLFGRRLPALCYNFPKMYKDEDGHFQRKPGQFDGDPAAMAMIAACSEKGLFDPQGAVRGVGAWADDDGRLVYHTGDSLIIAGEPKEPTTHQGRIYPAYPSIPHPATSEKFVDPVHDLLETLRTWQWSRPDVDPMIVLGMIGSQMLGGALDWRATFWVTGGKSTGKSQFQNLIRHLHGEKGLVQSTDATKSGLTSQLGHSSLPVAIDELEPGDEGSKKERDIIVLARVASSGGQWVRGSSDQKGASGNVYSTFMFSSILIPGELKAQDLSRLIILTLQAFPEGLPPLVLRADTWRKRGAALKRLLIDRWPTWAARLMLYREAFAEEGLSGRNGDNWATTLAMADMALHENLPELHVVQSWARKVALVVRADTEEIGDDAEAMLLHLLSQPYDIYRRGEHFTVAQWFMAAAQLPGAPSALMGGDTPVDKADYAKQVNSKLGRSGMRIVGKGHEATLFLANAKIQGLKDLFRNSEWANGAWTQSAKRVRGAYVDKKVHKLAGVPTRGTVIPFAAMPGLLSFPMDRDETPPPSEPQSPGYGEEDFA